MAANSERAVAFQVAVDGLLQFLRIKGGKGPDNLALQVSPSIDVTDFYGVQSIVTAQEAAGPLAIAQTVASVVATQFRRYLSISGTVTIGAAAGTVCSLSLGFRLGATTPFVLLATNGPFAPVVGGIYRFGCDVRGLILPPQSQVLMRVDGNAGGADHNFTLEYSYQRLDGLP